MIKELSESEYLETFSDEMLEITETIKNPVDIWPYVKELNKINIIDVVVIEKHLVESVYRNSNSTFDHIVIPSKMKNVLLIIIVNLTKRDVEGHYKLDLNQNMI